MPPSSPRAIASTPDPRSAKVPKNGRLPVTVNKQQSAEDQDRGGFLPVVGIISAVTGTITAMAMVPSNPKREGVLVLSGVLMCLGLLIAPALAFFQNPRNILRTENMVGMAGVYWLFMDLVTAVYDLPYVDRQAVRMAFLASGAFATFFWVGTLHKPWRFPKFFLRSCSFRAETSVLLPMASLCFMLAMMAFAIPSGFDLKLMFSSLLENRFNAPWSRGELGGWRAIIDHLPYFGYLLPTLAIMLMRRKGFFHPSTLLGMVLAGIFLAFLLHSGSRRIVGVCLGSALTCWMLDRERVRLWQFMALVVSVVGILWVMQFMLLFRNAGLGDVHVSGTAVAAWKSMTGQLDSAGAPKGLAVDDNFYRLVQVISIVPEHHDFVYGNYLWYVLVRPIPRAIWENKPISGGFRLEDYDNVGATLSMSIVGEAWMSWGFPAVILTGWLFGRLSRMNAPLFQASTGSVGPMFYGYMTMILFVGWRSLQEVLLFSYALFGWILVTWLYAKIRGREIHES